MKNKYYSIYLNIIRNAKRANRKKGTGLYYELHHIVPGSLGGSDKSHNKVLLTAREHFITHACLIRFLTGQNKHKMIYGFDMMNKSSTNQQRYTNSRLFEANKKKLAIIRSESQKGEKHWSYGLEPGEHPLCGTTHSENTKLKISGSHKGKIFSEEHKINLGLRQLGSKNHMYGKTHKTKARKLVSDANSHRTFILKNGITKRVKNIELLSYLFDGWVMQHPTKGKKQRRVKCPHCDKDSNYGNAKRWHFDNCKHKEN